MRPPREDAAGEREPSVRAVFRVLAAATTDSGEANDTKPVISKGILTNYLDSSVAPGVGQALWCHWTQGPVGSPVRSSTAASSGSSNPPAAETIRMGPFVRGVASVLDSSAEERCALLFSVMHGTVLENEPGPLLATHAELALRRAYALDTGAAPSSEAPFRSAASAAEARCGLHGGRALLFARWAVDQLPGLSDVLTRHVERLCDSEQAVGLAFDEHRRVRQEHGLLALDVTQLMRLPQDQIRRVLSLHTSNVQQLGGTAAFVDAGAAEAPLKAPMAPVITIPSISITYEQRVVELEGGSSPASARLSSVEAAVQQPDHVGSENGVQLVLESVTSDGTSGETDGHVETDCHVVEGGAGDTEPGNDGARDAIECDSGDTVDDRGGAMQGSSALDDQPQDDACAEDEGLVLTREWRWLVSKALGIEERAESPRVPNGVQDSGAPAGTHTSQEELQLLFSSGRDGSSLHTLAEKLAGYTHGR